MIKLIEKTNLNSSAVYDSIKELAYMCALASNDMHYMHLKCYGDKFQECHEKADEYLDELRELCDFCFELYSEMSGAVIDNETFASQQVPTWATVPQQDYDFVSFFYTAKDILTAIVNKMIEIQNIPEITSDIVSEFDTWVRKFTKEVNYFIARRIGDTEGEPVYRESIMSASVRNRKRYDEAMYAESLDTLTVGEPYKLFSMIDEHIVDYDVKFEDIKKGDYIVKEFQFGTLPHGGDSGFIPYEVLEKYEDYTLLVTDGTYDYEIYFDPSAKSEKYHRLDKKAFKK